MKKTLSIIAIAVIGFGLVSCKKENEKTTVDLTPDRDSLADSNAPITTVEGKGDSVATLPLPAEKSVTATPPIVEKSEPAKPTGPNTTLALSKNSHDFGKVKKGNKVQHVFEITNTGKNPLVISEVKPACGCTAPDYTKEPILPGKKGKVTLSFDSSSFDGPQSKYADVFANVENAPIRLSFTADVQP